MKGHHRKASFKRKKRGSSVRTAVGALVEDPHIKAKVWVKKGNLPKRKGMR